MNLPVDHAHFERWIEIFIATIDSLFAGAKAEQAKRSAKKAVGKNGAFSLMLDDPWDAPKGGLTL